MLGNYLGRRSNIPVLNIVNGHTSIEWAYAKIWLLGNLVWEILSELRNTTDGCFTRMKLPLGCLKNNTAVQ